MLQNIVMYILCVLLLSNIADDCHLNLLFVTVESVTLVMCVYVCVGSAVYSVMMFYCF